MDHVTHRDELAGRGEVNVNAELLKLYEAEHGETGPHPDHHRLRDIIREAKAAAKQ